MSATAFHVRRQDGQRGQGIGQCELLSIALVAEALLSGRPHQVLEDGRYVTGPTHCGVGELRRINVCKILIKVLLALVYCSIQQQ